MKQSKRHAQKGVDMGKCPECMHTIWSTQKTVLTPVKVKGKYRGVLIHATCPAGGDTR